VRLSAWPPLPPDVWAAPARDVLPFPLQEPDCRLFSRGRHALWHGLGSLPLRPGDAILAPAYHHGSEIEVFDRRGLECRFYGLTDGLEPDEDHLEALLEPAVRALQLVHYLGHPQDAARWRHWCDQRGLLLIEDAAMAWLADTADGPVGVHGDVAIYCLYKSFGLPDGAALVARGAPRAPPARGPRQLRAVAGLHAAWLAQRVAVAPLPERSDDGAYDPAEDRALGDVETPLGAATGWLLARIADRAAATARRAHARMLVEGLGDHVPAPFDAPPVGAAPFALPVHAFDKPALLERLARRGIEALDFWSHAHPRLDTRAFPEIAARRASTVALPVHQELGPGDIERILAAVADPPARRAPEPLEPIAELDDAREPWQELAARTDNVFATWEWAAAWWQHLGRPGGLRVLLRPGVALLPLQLTRERGLRVLRFVGHGPADQNGPVCAADDAPAAARALRQALTGPLRAWDLLVGEHLPADQGWDALIGAPAVAREASPVVDLAGRDWEAFLATQSTGLRKQIRYQERRLEREHELRYRLAADPDRLDEDFALLCRLHAQRWAGGESDAFRGARRAFLADFARRALARGWLRLWFLELDGRPAAAWLGFRYGGVESYYQGGRDPAFDDRSVGAVLVAHTIREAIGDGMREYRFLRGGEAYKSRLATRDPGLQTVVATGSAAGSGALAALRARRTLARARA
jgi:CelD/BcsL family acetyltransferase involved in cellulose biosynthesis/dTDP-4-amino-4,6-dideoxygalactose transaminase